VLKVKAGNRKTIENNILTQQVYAALLNVEEFAGTGRA
jgi:hypothetical protein